MKEKLILEISNAMTEILSVEQLAKLNGVLLKSISKYTVSMGEEQAPSLATSNETLLKTFLSAKQVEGCSHPTIRYYGNTIKQLADNMPKRFTDYTTEDIRAQDFILTPGRYVGIAEQEDDGEPFEDKMKRLTSELRSLFEQSHQLEGEIRRQLGSIGFEI